jgi:hypothetical protein
LYFIQASCLFYCLALARKKSDTGNRSLVGLGLFCQWGAAVFFIGIFYRAMGELQTVEKFRVYRRQCCPKLPTPVSGGQELRPKVFETIR